MLEVDRLGAADYEEAMDLLNMVFSMSSVPHDFPRLLPKLYRQDEKSMQANLAIRRDGRIRAIIGLFPMELEVGGRVLKVGGIGGVATHPRETGAGFMRRLMSQALADMKAEGYTLSVLGGQRQRYNYYGYEKAGASLDFTLTKANIRHYCQKQVVPEYRFVPVNLDPATQTGADAGHLALMKSWHDAQPCHINRPAADFPLILASWYATAWLALDTSGAPCAYLVSSKDGNCVTELIAADEEFLLPVAVAWHRQRQADNLRFKLKPWSLAAIRQFAQVCEYWSVNIAYNVQILDWPAVLESLLCLKAEQLALPAGQLTLRIDSSDQPVDLVLSVDGRQVACAAGSGLPQPDLILDAATATRLVLGPLSPDYVLPDDGKTTPAVRYLMNSWFPLPFAFAEPDDI